MLKQEKIKVEICSDVMCPFCYIGKRKFEEALQQFNPKEQVEVIWHSYLLDPYLQHVPGKTTHEVLGEKKGWSPQQARQIGVRGVPFFLLNEIYGISGAQPSAVFLQASNQVWEDEKPQALSPDTGSGPVCTDGICE